MATSLGALRVSLGLDAAEFVKGLTKAEFQAQKFARSLSTDIAIGIVKAEVALKLLGEAASFAIRAFPELIEQAGHFQDLAEKTGASAEALASFSIAAKVAGTSIDDVATFSVKLSKNLVSVDEEASKTAIGLQALGIPIKEFKALDPAAQVDALSKALAKFNNLGGGKAAVLENIAKGGANLLPFLKELEESGGRQITLTEAQIKKADEFADATARSKAQLNAFAQFVAVEASGAVAALAKAVKDFVQDLLGLDTESKNLRDNNAIAEWANNAARALAFVGDSVDSVGRIFSITGNVIGASAAQITALAAGDLKAYNAIQEDASAAIDKIIARQTLRFHLEENIAKQAAAAARPVAKDTRPSLPIPSTGIAAAAIAKKTLDGQLKALDNFVSAEQATLQDRERFLSRYYQDDQIGLRDFFAGRRAALEEAAGKEIAAFDKQAELLRSFAAKAKPQDRIEAETKLADVLAKRAKLEQDVATKGIELFLDETRAVKLFRESVEQASIALAEMRGDTVTAAAAGFDFANRRIKAQLAELRKSANPEDQSLAAIGERDLESTRKLVVARAELSKATKDYSLILDQLGIVQERIDIGVQFGNTGQIEALIKKTAATQAYIGVLQQQLVVAQAAAIATGSPEEIQRVEKLRVALEGLQAQGDLLAKTFNDIIGTSFASAISDLASGTKTFKEAVSDMAKSITKSINDLVAQDIAKKLFGGGGSLSGIGDFFSKIFGGAGGSVKPVADAATKTAEATSALALTGSATALTASGAAVTASSAALDLSAVTLTTAGVSLEVAATSLIAAAAAQTAGSAASGLSGLFGSALSGMAQGGGLAGGTDNWRGGLTWVGEHGKELVNLPKGAQVIPNDVLMRGKQQGNVIHLTVNVPRGTSGPSADQIATQTGAALQRALARNS